MIFKVFDSRGLNDHKGFKKIKSTWHRFLIAILASPEDIFAAQQFLQTPTANISAYKCLVSRKLSWLKTLHSLFLLKKLHYQHDELSANAPTQKNVRGKVYFKTIFYAPHELPFIRMNLFESYPFVDKFIIVEGNRTQVGEPRDFIFEKYFNLFPKQLRDKVLYIPSDISSKSIDCNKSDDSIVNA